MFTDAVNILNITEQINSEVLEEEEGEKEKEKEKEGERERNDRHCVDPVGLCEILMLKGDLFVEISQAENITKQIIFKSKAMECFQRAKKLSTWILHEAGWMDQATSTVGNGAYNQENISVRLFFF